MATIPAVFWVPLRRSRSWPAAHDQRIDLRAATLDQDADTLRAAELVGAERQQVDVRRDLAQVEPAGALDGVGVEERVGRVAAHDPAHLDDVGDRADLVVDRHHADDRHVGRVRRAPAPTRRDRCCPRRRHRPRHRRGVRRRAARRGARRPNTPATPPRRLTAPDTAMLSLSVPQPVNTTSPGRHPTTSATASRASSIARRAWRAKRCEPDGLAYELGEVRQHRLDRLGAHRAWRRRDRGR